MSTTEAAAGNTTNGGQSLCWSYDSFGNGTAQSSQSGACPILPSLPPATAIYNANNQVTWTSVHGAALGLGYDAAGNVINDNLNSYLYDADGTRVAKGTITSMSCDPAVNGFQTTTDYVLGLAGEQVTEVGVNANGTLAHQHTNVWAGGKLLGTYDNDGLHFYLDDPLGTRRVQTDYAGAIEQQCVSFPFGDGESCTATPTEHLFTGKERDTESGLDYFGARYNSSAMGRFMSPDWSSVPDTVPHAIFSDPQSLNLYSYTANNPINYSDPDGHQYTVCDQNGQCNHQDDKTFEQAEAGARSVGDVYSHGTITLADGSAGGSYHWDGPDIPGDAASNIAALGNIGNGGMAAINEFVIQSTIGAATEGAGQLIGIGVDAYRAGRAIEAINTGSNVVYKSLNAAGDVEYVGITNNLARRAGEHAGRGFQIEAIPGLSNLSRVDARAVEQVLIETHGLASEGGTLVNKINSIASTNPAYAQALQRGAQILKQVGYFK